jgi:hypothetical protein
MSERFRQDLIRFLAAHDANGVWSDEDTQAEGMSPTTPAEALPIVTRWAIDELQADIAAGEVPGNVRTFAELHDHVDANKYGGAFDWDRAGLPLVGDVDDTAYVQAHCDFWNAIQEGVNRWLQERCN